MNEMLKKALEINTMDTEELIKNRGNLFDKLIALGADPEDLVDIAAITTELVIRDFKKTLIEA